MDFNYINRIALEEASKDFGSDVLKEINKNIPSSANSRLTLFFASIQTLTNIFEVQKDASDKNVEHYIKDFNSSVKEALEGDGEESVGTRGILKDLFMVQELKRDLSKKRAIAFYLKRYLQHIDKHVKVVSVEEFLGLPIQESYGHNYFDKNYVFGSLMTIIDANMQ
jgi:hypothetical protein